MKIILKEETDPGRATIRRIFVRMDGEVEPERHLSRRKWYKQKQK